MAKQPTNYVFTAASGDTITLPWLDKVLNAGFLRRNRNKSEDEQMWTLLETFADEDELEKIDKLSMAELADLFTGWQKGLEASLGESSKQ